MSTQFTFQQMIECVEREVRFRKYVYPRRVAAGKMSQAKADEETECMVTIAGVLKDIVLAQEFDLK